MSLINEALKRARSEAAREEAERRGVRYGSVPVHVPEPRRGRWLWPLVAGCLVLLAVALWWFWPAAGEPERVAEAVTEEGGQPQGQPLQPPAVTEERGQPQGQPLQSQEAPETLLAPSREPAVPAPPARPEPPPEPAEPTEKTYLHRAPLPGGGELKLDFIVWADEPFAQIGGQFYEVGQMVSGWRVVEIERERVKLEGPEGTIVLRAR